VGNQAKNHNESDSKNGRKVDVLRQDSDLGGMAGLLEGFLRKFRNLAFLMLLIPVFGLSILCLSISITPSIVFFRWIYGVSTQYGMISSSFMLGFGLVFSYLLYGFTVILVAPAINFILPLRLKAWRGSWHSIQTIPWYVHNALTYLVRYTFLEFFTPTPFNILFYRLMGMKIGKGVVINTTNISDPCMITLGDYVTIGGSATLIGHYGQKGFLVISPVEIGAHTTIGLKASIMGGVKIGKKVSIKPHTVLVPNTNIPDGETVGFY